MAGMPTSAGIRSAPQLKQPRNPISRKQVEAVISRSIAVSGVVFGGQTVGPLLGQVKDANSIWVVAVVVALSVSILFAILMSILERAVRVSHGIVAGIYVVALVSWPLAVLHPHVHADNHWLYYLLTIGTATAAIAFSTRVATAYLFAVPILYGIIRTTPAGGSPSVAQSTLDVIYSIILGGAIMIIVTMLRQAAANVDTAQGTALERYGHAVRQHATDVERVQVDSIVHDSVLTTLLSAARAYTPEAMELAATMAGNAIGHLHDAALVQPDDATIVRLRTVVSHILDSARAMSVPFDVRVQDVGPRSIPVAAGDAIYSAAVQSMVNSIQHAGDGVSRWVGVKSARPGGLEVEVGDTGGGFVIDAVPTERLGVRVSIIERVANAGGSTVIVSAPSQGTIVTLRWPAIEVDVADPDDGDPESLTEPLLSVDLLSVDLHADGDGAAR
jgi:signal transduction histidine kinase